MSVGEWLNTVILPADGTAGRDDRKSQPEPRERPQPAAVDERLDLADRLARIAPAHDAPITGTRGPQRPQAAGELSAIEQAVAEITARQRALDSKTPPGQPAPAAAPVDLSGLEQQLRRITSQIEALRPASDLESAIAALRAELAEMGKSVTEALPRRAVESLEIEVKALAQRIDHTRQSGIDGAPLTTLERGVSDVRDGLRGLTTAENLVGVEEAVRALSRRVDNIAANQDPAALQQLEAAIGALRGIISHVASNDTLTKVAEEVRGLSAKVDGLAMSAASGEAISALETRVGSLADALTASTAVSHAVPRELEKLLAGMVEKLEWVQLTHTDHAALAHLEDRIATLVKRLELSDSRLGHLEAIERGLADLLVHIEQLRGGKGDGGNARAGEAVNVLKQEMAQIKESDRRTQETLEAVHGTLEYMVDRLATIESDRPGDPNSGPVPASANLSAPVAPQAPAQMPASAPLAVLEPAAAKAAPGGPAPVNPVPAASAPGGPPLVSETPAPPARKPAAARTPIDPSLPPDHPLEPGSASGRPRPVGSAADRIAASEAALGPAKPPVIPDPAGKSNFIAAARKAAQAAAAAAPAQPANTAAPANGAAAEPQSLAQRLRALLVAGSVVLIVIGGVQIASRFVSSDPAPGPAAAPPRTAETPSAAAAGSGGTQSQPPIPAAPEVETDPSPAKRAPGGQSSLNENSALPVSDTKLVAAAPPLPSPIAAPEFTGSVNRAAMPPAVPPPAAAAPASNPAADATADKLPAGIGGPGLRAAALAGDAGAAYEVAARFAEGHGVVQNYEQSAYWLERAAKLGLVPAEFRLGGLYEKGLGVKKDLAAARDHYLAAAGKGNAKAMHNLAVLYAEGIDGKADYRAAAQWFRKAADFGVADSQYNLGILYARGIGVELNLPESYKWFSLAAKQGDKEAAKKRDDVAARLDKQALTAANGAAETWTAATQPDEATNTQTPAAGWDRPAAAAPAAKPKARGAQSGLKPNAATKG